MAEVHHLKFQSLIKQQALEVLCVPAVGKRCTDYWLVQWPLPPPPTLIAAADDLFFTAT